MCEVCLELERRSRSGVSVGLEIKSLGPLFLAQLMEPHPVSFSIKGRSESTCLTQLEGLTSAPCMVAELSASSPCHPLPHDARPGSGSCSMALCPYQRSTGLPDGTLPQEVYQEGSPVRWLLPALSLGTTDLLPPHPQRGNGSLRRAGHIVAVTNTLANPKWIPFPLSSG